MTFALCTICHGCWLLLSALIMLIASIWHRLACIIATSLSKVGRYVTYGMNNTRYAEDYSAWLKHSVFTNQCKMDYCMIVDSTTIYVSDEPNPKMINWLYEQDNNSNSPMFFWIPKDRIIDVQFAIQILDTMSKFRICPVIPIQSGSSIRYYHTSSPEKIVCHVQDEDRDTDAIVDQNSCTRLLYHMVAVIPNC